MKTKTKLDGRFVEVRCSPSDRFVQITSTPADDGTTDIYALAEMGTVWRYRWNTYRIGDTTYHQGWYPLVMDRQER